MWFIIAGTLLTLYYTFLMRYYYLHWKRCKTPHLGEEEQHRFSILVPVRNESAQIISCLESLRELHYDKNKFEIILIDDHSTDDTVKRAEDFKAAVPDLNLRVLQLKGKDFGKKTAICEGVEAAQHEIIVCTDGDCVVSQDWLKVYDAMYGDERLKLITGPVTYFPGKHFAEKVQALEFCGLVAIGGASIAAHNPTTSNGANISYRKEVFKEIRGYDGNKNYASGDDDFLLHKVFATYPLGVSFAKHEGAIVRTAGHIEAGSFFRQRIRWVSKSAAYPNYKVTLTLALAYLYNLFLLSAAIAGFFNTSYLALFLSAFLLKLVVEWIFYRQVLRFFGYKQLLPYLIPAQPFHVCYVVLIGILGNIAGYKWKERDAKEYAALS